MTSSATLKSRFCPSPTGLMHLGNLRTALFNVLLAKSQQAQGHTASFLLRIEDSDMVRSEAQYTQALMSELRCLGLDWQEGPEQPKGHEPYFQSQRTGLYQKYYQQLIAQKKAYWCFCTDAELAITRKTQLQAGQPPRYAGTCRHLTEQEITDKRAKGLVPALRFHIPDNETVYFEDFIQGPKTFLTNDIGDFIIEKADGSSSFMFCNAIDDALMGVTHVMRGEDHLTNTPRQLLILQALQLTNPTYGHMPLILGFDGKPLSKRNGSQSIESLREQGYFPDAINNYLARLGHHLECEQLLSLDELGKHFNTKHIARSPARFDLAQLNHWQKECVMLQSEESLWQWMKPMVQPWVSDEHAPHFTQMIKQNIVLPAQAAQWAKQLLTTDCVFDPEALGQLQHPEGQNVLNNLAKVIADHGEDYAQVVKALSVVTGLKGKALFLPLRSAITGSTSGPELAKIFMLMGKDSLLQRVSQAQQVSQNNHATHL